MAAPTPTVRQTPTGYRMDEGFHSKLTFSLRPALKMWEIEVQPMAVEGGEAIDTTTQLNAVWKTKAPRTLKESGPISMTVTYDPDEVPSLYGMINVARLSGGAAQILTILHPDSSTDAAYCFIKNFKPSKYKEGDKPTAEIEVVITNWDPVNGVEAGPVHTPSSGTA